MKEKGFATYGLINYLIQQHCHCNPVLLKDNHRFEDIARLTTGRYLLYAWKIGSNDPGHYVALVDGIIICNKYMKTQKPVRRQLSVDSLKHIFYGIQTSSIFAYDIQSRL